MKRLFIPLIIFLCEALSVYSLPFQLSAGLSYIFDTSHEQESAGEDLFNTTHSIAVQLGFFNGGIFGSYIVLDMGSIVAVHITDNVRSEYIDMDTYKLKF